MGTFSSMFLGRLRGIQDHFLIVIQCYLKLVSTYHQNHLPCCQWSMSTLGSIYGTQASPLIGANKTPEGKVPCPRLWERTWSVPAHSPSGISTAVLSGSFPLRQPITGWQKCVLWGGLSGGWSLLCSCTLGRPEVLDN